MEIMIEKHTKQIEEVYGIGREAIKKLEDKVPCDRYDSEVSYLKNVVT